MENAGKLKFELSPQWACLSIFRPAQKLPATYQPA
jgi:hypothetical protein